MNPSPGVRWWPLLLVCAIAVVTIIALQLLGDRDQQLANMQSVGTGVIAALLVLVWFFAFSRLRGRVKLLGLAVFAVTCVLLRTGFRGVSGDLLPIFAWGTTAAPLPAAPAAAAPETGLAAVPGLADSPQFFGSERTGKLAGPILQRDWQQHPPTELWRQPIGTAWSGFAVTGRLAITQEQHGPREMIVCYDIVTGEVLWTHADEMRFENPVAGTGPRATPTIDADRVYAQGATGMLNCLATATGTVVWSKNILTDNDAAQPEWGVAGSPLIHAGRVIVCAGGAADGSLVAYDKLTGSRVWSGGSESAHWSSPIHARIAGVEQILIFNGGGVAAHAADDGRPLWSYPWPNTHPHVCLPVVVGDRVLISSGYGTGAELIEIARDDGGTFATRRIWQTLAMKAKFCNIIAKDGFVYGLDDGRLACIDLQTGERRWKQGRYGHGQLLLVGELLLVTTESGDVVLVDPVPEEPRELTRFTAFADKTWNPPTLAGEYLLVRNDVEVACYRLPVE